MQLTHMDLGPSYDAGVAHLKEKYGFAYVADWYEQCDYEGPFRYDICASQTMEQEATWKKNHMAVPLKKKVRS